MTTPSGLSLRVRLTALVVVLLGAGLIVSSLLATTALRGYLLDRVDEQLTAGARPFGTFPERLRAAGPRGGRGSSSADPLLPGGHRRERDAGPVQPH